MLRALCGPVLQPGSRLGAESLSSVVTSVTVSWPQRPFIFAVNRTMGSTSSSDEVQGSSEAHTPAADPQEQAKHGAEASARPQTVSSGIGVDLFTQAMQSKAEEQLRRMLEQQSRISAASTQASSTEDDMEDDEDLSDEDKILPNPETGEVLGPAEKNQGKEPTRFGDWEIRGRCTDW